MSTRFALQGDVSGETLLAETAAFEETSRGEIEATPAPSNSVAMVDATPDLDLGRFLQRPVTIRTYTWSTTDPIGVLRTFEPWYDYMNTAAVKNKLENYAFLRGKLHMKIVINATPFQYGLLRCSYSPLLGTISSKIRTNTVSDEPLRIPYSQQPGFYIEPQANTGGEMECPFFYHKNWLDITSATDVQKMGTANLVVYAPLAVALPTAPTTLTVKVVAWMSDVTLMGATSALALQGDEYGNGPVSAPATAVANFASNLTHVPVIGRFARATEIGASALSKIATIFGFTNPPNIENVRPIYQMSAPHLATAEISVPYQKLTLDPKTELSIDPSIFGLPNQDELCINYLKKKESFVGDMTWNTTDAEGVRIFSTLVTPTLKSSVPLQNSVPATVGYRHYNTPLSHLSYVFNDWRGTMKFRFHIICSKYHKGRLKISWDPLNSIDTTDPGLNECYTHILDIGETTDFTLTVPYHQAIAWLRTDPDSVSNGWTNSGTLGTVNRTRHNGSIAVRVYNTLEAPSAAPIKILVYVSAGDDFEFNNPKGFITAGDSVANTDVPSFFALQGERVLGDETNADASRYGQNYGESVLSLRKLMRRSHIADTVQLPVGVTQAMNIYRKGIFRIPYTPGFVNTSFPTSANKVVAASGTASYAFTTMHIIPWVASMYLGIRGGVNYTLTVNSPDVRPDDIRVMRTTDQGAVTASNRLVTLNASILGSASFSTKTAALGSIWNVRDGIGGMVLTSTSVAPTVQFTIPDNNGYNFTLSDWNNWIEGSDKDSTDLQGALVSIAVANTSTTDRVGYTTVSTAAGIGSDFTCLFFLCCPTIDNLIGDPVPV